MNVTEQGLGEHDLVLARLRRIARDGVEQTDAFLLALPGRRGEPRDEDFGADMGGISSECLVRRRFGALWIAGSVLGSGEPERRAGALFDRGNGVPRGEAGLSVTPAKLELRGEHERVDVARAAQYEVLHR